MISDIPKNIVSELDNLVELSNELGFPKVYLVGGIVRDHFLGLKISEKSDIDITVNDGFKSNLLGLSFGYKNNYNMKYINGQDIKVYFKESSFDFSTGKISKSLRGSEKSRIYKETLSRDFTINSLLYSVEDKRFVDISGNGIKDCLNKIIRTNLGPEETFSEDKSRIIRAIYFASKYNLTISEDIIEYVKNNYNDIKIMIEEKRNFIISKINEAVMFDSQKTLDILQKMKILKDIPLVGNFKNILIKNKLISDYYSEDMVNEAIDPIGGFVGNEYPSIFYGNSQQSVPPYGDSSVQDDNHVRIYDRQLPHLT